MKRLLVYITFCLLLHMQGACNSGRKPEQFTVNFTGDVLLDRGVADKIAQESDTALIHSMKQWLGGDFNVINLECVLAETKESRQKQFVFKAEPGKAQLLKKAGVTHAGVSNNHSYDFGQKGFKQTLKALKAENLAPLGAACKPQVLSLHGQQCAIIGASVFNGNEFICRYGNENLIRQIRQFNSKQPSTPLIVYIHWGIEYHETPGKRQTQIAEALIDHGADAVIGHHPHVVQSIAIIKGKPVIYSLGNFVFDDASKPGTETGLVAQAKVSGDSIEFSFIPVDLSSIFPKPAGKKQTLNLFLRHANLHESVCFFKHESGEWRIKPVGKVNFRESADVWLFGGLDGYQVMIRKLEGNNFKLSLRRSSRLHSTRLLRGNLSNLEIADINHDRKEELLLSITKPVRFDRQMNKRLNVFRVKSGNLQSLWLGTHFMHDLKSFSVIQKADSNYLRTLEQDSTSTLYHGIYAWENFGFQMRSMKQTTP